MPLPPARAGTPLPPVIGTDRDATRRAMDLLTGLIHGPSETGARSPAELAAFRALRRRRMEALLERLGRPHRAFRALIVGGTSGKSSTATMIGSILAAAGRRAGVYTNPFVQSPTEKVQIDGEPIAPSALADLAALVVREARALEPLGLGQPTYAEAWFALAARYFADAGAEFGVIEVGVGGRYDPTNVVDPEVAVVTTVDFDHTDVLGPTIEAIADHKAGIIAAGRPAVTGARRPEALAVIEREAERVGATLWRLGTEFDFAVSDLSDAGGALSFHGPGGSHAGLRVGLLGEHQCFNAAVSTAAVQALATRGVDVGEAALRRGLERARLPGRLEVLRRQPILLLDGAHNPEKARSLRAAIARLFRYRRLLLVFGALRSKDVDGLLAEVGPVADRVFTAAAPVAGKPACSPEELAARVAALGRPAVPCASPAAAVEAALAAAGRDDLVCVTGSLFLVGAVRAWWLGQ